MDVCLSVHFNYLTQKLESCRHSSLCQSELSGTESQEGWCLQTDVIRYKIGKLISLPVQGMTPH